VKNRKTYFRKDIGRAEIEGGWFPGESWAIEAHAGFSPSDRRLCLVYLQVAKLCFSITVDTGRRVSLDDAADWGEKFEAAAHRGPMPAPKAEGFQAGKLYRWIGPEKPIEWGIPNELSDIWIKGKPHRCIIGTADWHGAFKGIGAGRYPDSTAWAYKGCDDNFEEVTE
jgi:hypothetical protein